MADVKLIGYDPGSLDDFDCPDYLTLNKFTAIESGSLTAIRVEVFIGGHINILVALYSDNAGAPGVVLAQSVETNCVAGVTAVSLGPESITKDTVYWLAFLADGYGFGLKTDAAAVNKYKYTTYDSEYTFPDNPTSLGTTANLGDSLAGWGEVAAGGFAHNQIVLM